MKRKNECGEVSQKFLIEVSPKIESNAIIKGQSFVWLHQVNYSKQWQLCSEQFFPLVNKKNQISREANFLTQNFALQTQQPGYRFSRIIFIFSLCGGKLCRGKINNPAGVRVVNGPGKFQNKSSPNSNSRRPRRIGVRYAQRDADRRR